ncbi:hypothetical protein JXB31_00890 [Candidatus Woesearchaeota archaeon]|nr:hypothetical protein [Candidatus Woesearchaeota archaeon]
MEWFIDKDDFKIMKKEIEGFDLKREMIISKSREILKSSKYAIYAVHKGELAEAKKLLNQAEKVISALKKEIENTPRLQNTGAFSAAAQEYAEARCFYGFAKDKKIPSVDEMGILVEDYLLGLCDLTGELGRRAVMSVIKNDIDEVYMIRDAVEGIFGMFLELNLRNSELRKKSDQIKWNLKKIEDIIYDIKTRGIKNGKSR